MLSRCWTVAGQRTVLLQTLHQQSVTAALRFCARVHVSKTFNYFDDANDLSNINDADN